MSAVDIYVEALRRLCETHGGAEKVAAAADLSLGNMKQILAGTLLPSGNPRGVGPGLRKRLTEVFPGWLDGASLPVTGEQTRDTTGHLSGFGGKGSTLQPILSWEHPDDLPDGEFVLIPRLNVQLSAGDGKEQVEIEFVEQQPQAFRADWIRKKRLKPKKLASMVADGDSMEERIQSGDALVVDTSQVDVVDGKVYALWYDGGERVKRLYRLPGGGLRIKSDNEKHPTIEVAPRDIENVRIIGRVVHIAGEGGL